MMDTDANTIPPAPEASAGKAKKYIRTLEGDMEIVKKGGAPDLAPLKELQTPAERLVAASPITPPAEEKPAPVVEERKEMSVPEIKSSPIQTYEGDFRDKVKEEKASPATVLAAEQDARDIEDEPALVKKRSLGGIFYTLFGIIFLIVGGVGVYIAYTRYAVSLIPVILAPTVSSPIFVDERKEVSGTGAALLQEIEESVTDPLASGSVRLLYTKSSTTTDQSVFSALQKPAPDILLRNINAENSMAGVVNVGGVQSPFFILSVISYSSTFSGMLSWEKTMPGDLTELFPAYSNIIASSETNAAATSTLSAAVATTTATTTIAARIATTTATTTASTTTATTTSPSIIKKMVAGFRDEVVGNHDVRIYRDENGQSIVLYGYWNQTTLIIARDPLAFTEIINRLATSQSQQ